MTDPTYTPDHPAVRLLAVWYADGDIQRAVDACHCFHKDAEAMLTVARQLAAEGALGPVPTAPTLPPEPVKRSCGTCNAFLLTELDYGGRCRSNPPTPLGNWPVVLIGDQCRQWQPAEVVGVVEGGR